MMDYARIPRELKELDQWVCTWDSSKVPMKAFERRAASSTAPETWSSFEMAEGVVEAGCYDHVGFVFADNGIVGIDIDAGFDGDGLLTPLCADIMRTCRSYTEKSKSGRGIHILLRGQLPFPGRNNLKGVEIYQSRRFFIMTGDVLIFPDIIENQAAIDYVLERYFPGAERERKHAPLVQRIYSPVYPQPFNGRIFIHPEYPMIPSGGRNLSLTSLAGTMHNIGYSKAQIYTELCFVNQTRCKPPLPPRELESICDSVTRYKR